MDTLTLPSGKQFPPSPSESMNPEDLPDSGITPLDSAYLVSTSIIDPVKQPRNIGEFDHEEDRKLIDQIAEERALKGGIAGTGILQAILLRPDATGNRFLIVAGERRYRAASYLGLKQMPALIEEMTATAAWRAAIVENIQRRDLTPNEEGHAFETWMQDEGVTKEEIAKQIGRSVSYVQSRIDILGHAADLRLMVSENPRTTRAARELGIVPEHIRRPVVERLKGGASYNSEKQEIQNLRQKAQARQRQNEMERAGEEPGSRSQTIKQLPRVGYGDLITRMSQAVEEAIDVCADVPPQGEKKREMERAIDALTSRLDHLRSII